MSRPGDMREVMPSIASFIDDMRATFGANDISQSVREGLARNRRTEEGEAARLAALDARDPDSLHTSAGDFWAIEGNGGWSYEGNTVLGHPFCTWPRGVSGEALVVGKPNVNGPKARR